MNTVMLLLVAALTWMMRDWGPIDHSEKAIPLRAWIFRTPSLDKKLDEWLGS